MAIRRLLLATAAAIAITIAIGAPAPDARATTAADAGIEQRALPPEARETLEQIRRGGPYRYDRDGITFGNREGLLPPKPRGYYHEYTVPTPGTKSRGARRIICGGPPRTPDACWYTADHYRSFRRIRE